MWRIVIDREPQRILAGPARFHHVVVLVPPMSVPSCMFLRVCIRGMLRQARIHVPWHTLRAHVSPQRPHFHDTNNPAAWFCRCRPRYDYDTEPFPFGGVGGVLFWRFPRLAPIPHSSAGGYRRGQPSSDGRDDPGACCHSDRGDNENAVRAETSRLGVRCGSPLFCT